MNEFIRTLGEEGLVANYGDDEEGESTIVFDDWGSYATFLRRVADELVELIEVTATAVPDIEDGRFPRGLAIRFNLMPKADVVKHLQLAFTWIQDKDDDDAGEIDINDDDIEQKGHYCTEWYVDMDDLFELLGFKGMGFTDEHEACSECCKIVYTSATSWFDHGRFIYTDDGLMCRECVEKNADWYLEDYLEKVADGQTAGYILDLPEGFEFITEEDRWGTSKVKFQNGWHPGMDDSPKRQLESLRKFGIEQAIFEVEPSQFYVEWAVAVRKGDLRLATAVLNLEARGYKHKDCVVAWEDLCGADDLCWERQYMAHIQFDENEPYDRLGIQVVSGSEDPRRAIFEGIIRAVDAGNYALDREGREILYEMCIEGEGEWISYKTKDDEEPAELMKRALQNVQYTEIDRDAFVEGKIVPAKPGESGIKYANLGGQE